VSLRYFLEKHRGYRYVAAAEASPDWDYSILLPAAAKFFPNMLRDWPPPGTVHQIMAGGAPINAIIANPLHVQEHTQAALLNEGLVLLYARGQPAAAAATFRRVLEANPTHYGAHYQLAVALDRAGARAEARTYWEKVLRMAEATGDQKTARAARTRLQQKP
jgi:tetratricopeptide (TPR) repeat protein